MVDWTKSGERRRMRKNSREETRGRRKNRAWALASDLSSAARTIGPIIGDVDDCLPLVDEWLVVCVGWSSYTPVICGDNDKVLSSWPQTIGACHPGRKLGRIIFEKLSIRVIFFDFL